MYVGRFDQLAAVVLDSNSNYTDQLATLCVVRYHIKGPNIRIPEISTLKMDSD